VRLYTKISITATFILLVSTTVIVLVVSNRVEGVLVETIKVQQLNLAHTVMDKIDRALYAGYQDIKVIGGATPIENSLIFKETSTSTDEIALFADIAQERLEEFLLQTGPWDALKIFDLQGVLLVATDDNELGNELEKHSINETEAFNYVVETGSTYVSDFVFSKDKEKGTIIFATPVYNENVSNRSIVGVVIGNYAWPVIQEILETVDNEGTHLFNREGFIISSHEGAHEGVGLTENQKDHFIITLALKGESVSRLGINIEGKTESLMSVATQDGYLGYKSSGWILYLDTPSEVALFKAKTISRNVGVIMVFLMIVVVLIFILILHIFIVRPVKSLSKTSKEIAAGNLKMRAEVALHDELGDLSTYFNEMADSLVGAQNRYKLNNKKLKSATIELEEKIVELERFNKIAVGRELKMVALKEEIKRLKNDP
jgi:HAMP domain-containing protein